MKLSKEQIDKMTHEQVYELYKEKKRKCKTIAQEVELITSDPEMIMLRERLMNDNAKRSNRQ
jgi:hypothetical protein